MLRNEIVLKGTDLLEKWAQEKNKEVIRAMGIALKKTSFETMKIMREDLKKDKLGLTPVSVLTNKPYVKKTFQGEYGTGYKYQKQNYSWAKKRAPLRNLFHGITYQVNTKDPETNQYKYDSSASIGFGLRSMKTMWHEKWAGEHLAGYIWRYTKTYTEWLHRLGIHLKKNTLSGNVPTRDIIGAFRARREKWIIDTLKKYFELKMAGKTWK